MNSKRCAVLVAFAAILSLTSCSGVKNVCTVNCGGGGNALVSVSITDTPPTNTSILSMTFPIVGVSLMDSTGALQPVFSSNTPANIEMTRLQSDSDLLVLGGSVPAGTYTAVQVTMLAPTGVFVNSSAAVVNGCAIAAVCALTQGAPTSITYTLTSQLVLSGNQNAWLDLDFNYNNAVTSTAGINVSQANVLTVKTTPPVGIPTGVLANIDDFTGAVTAISASTITVTSTVRGSLTASFNSSTTPLFDPQSQCTAGSTPAACIQKGSIVSLQGVLTNTGGINATSLDIIDISPTPADEVEGTIYPSNCNGGSNYGLILSDSSISTSGSPLATAPIGKGVCLTLGGAVIFPIDYGILTGQPGLPIGGTGFSQSTDLLAGQRIRAKITGAAAGVSGINATATAMMLRFSRLTGTINTVSSNGFTVTNLPIYIIALGGQGSVQTYVNATLFEGVADPTGLTGTASFTALLFNPATVGILPPLQAAKVRQQ